MAKRSKATEGALIDVNDFESFDQFVERFRGTVGGITDAQRETAAELLIAEINDPGNHRRGNKIGDRHDGLHEESLNDILVKLTSRHGDYAFLQTSGCCACIFSLFTPSKGRACDSVIEALQRRALVLFEERHIADYRYIENDIERGAAGRDAPSKLAAVGRWARRQIHDAASGVPQNTPYDVLMNMKPIMDAKPDSAHFRNYQQHIAAVNKQDPAWKEKYDGRHSSVLGRAFSIRMVRAARE